MKKNTNRKYIKKKLNELLVRKYVEFQNVLSYVKNPWEVVKLKAHTIISQYKVNDNDTNIIDINNNEYCKNYVENVSQGNKLLVLYRKYVLKFQDRAYFIFEKKNKANAIYRLYERYQN